MKSFIIILITITTAIVAQADPKDSPYSLNNPVNTLNENQCVFKNKSNELTDYQFIVGLCDGKPLRNIFLFRKNLKQGHCVFNLVSKMTGLTLAFVESPCQGQQEQQALIPKDNIADEEIEAMPPAPEQHEKPAKKVVAKQKITKKEPLQDEPAQVKPGQNNNVEKDNQDTPEIKNYIPPAIDTDF